MALQNPYSCWYTIQSPVALYRTNISDFSIRVGFSTNFTQCLSCFAVEGPGRMAGMRINKLGITEMMIST